MRDWYGTLEKEIVISTFRNGYLLDLELVRLGAAVIR